MGYADQQLRDAIDNEDIPAVQAFALAELVAATDGVGRALHALGNADAATPFGGLEGLGMAIIEAAERVAGAISDAGER